MPTRKAARTATEPQEGTGQSVATPSEVTTQTVLAPRVAAPAVGGEAVQPLKSQENARQTVLSSHTPRDHSQRMQDTIVERVLETLNVEGLSQELTTKLAEQMLSSVRVDALVTTLLEGQTEALTARLTDRLIARLLGLDE